MPANKFLVPQPGLVVRDPVTMEPLPQEGAMKPMNSYWLRRVAAGDAIQTPGPQARTRKGD